jgi:MYXO-CTERM domain-containing protein
VEVAIWPTVVGYVVLALVVIGAVWLARRRR